MRGFNITKGLALSSLTWSFNLRYSVHNPGVVESINNFIYIDFLESVTFRE
jgi:hypothetical protein